MARYNPGKSFSTNSWAYSKFGVELSNFKYIPILVFKVFAAGW
jgi:hypothetical protein